ncbi:MAG: hypothetical protein DRJ38_10795 [Thermoprotei archaeon]|nr:MAG: hypothetical protein DRJ38_10795 [Thermoprotei archaeon]
MLKKVILTTLKCFAVAFLSVLLIFMILSALGFSTYTISESSYKLPDKLSVGAALVFTPTYKETVLTAPTWFRKPEVGDQIIYESNIAGLGELTCIGWIKEADGDSYHIENPQTHLRHVYNNRKRDSHKLLQTHNKYERHQRSGRVKSRRPGFNTITNSVYRNTI